MKTLLFCTGYAGTLDQWTGLYGRWINAVESGTLEFDTLLIPDDGSPVLPNWPGIEVMTGPLPDIETASRGIIYHYEQNLGRQAIYIYPGWHRSFMLAAEYARKYGYEKIVHVESDAFLISGRIQQYINEFTSGWTVFWCPCHQIPETALQVIAGPALERLYSLIDQPYANFAGRPADPGSEQGTSWLPYDTVNRDYFGDRSWGERGLTVPTNADYAGQIPVGVKCWWLAE